MNQDTTAVWVSGKVHPGWYMAKGIWNEAYAKHLESLGYRVKRSVEKPTEK
jgi:hypothetical protein